jgi:hypothetical protein
VSKFIECQDGSKFIVDDDDFSALSAHSWRRDENGYAVRGCAEAGEYRIVAMHRVILGLEHGDPRWGDHRSTDKSDNRRSNLRVCTPAQNCQNQGIRKNNTSGFKGVQWMKAKKKWQAKICVNRVQKHLGLFETPEAAHEAYCIAARELRGEFANFGT